MGEPDVVTEPAEAVEVLERPLPEALEAELLLVVGLGQVRVQPHAAPAGELRGLGHQLGGDGERRRRSERDPDHRSGRGIVEAVDRLRARGEDRVALLDDRVRRQPAAAAPEVHRAAAGVEPEPDRPRRRYLHRQQVAGAAREDVVMVGRGRAARAGERGQPGVRGRVDHVGVDVRPDGIERGEPLEQRRLLYVAARRLLVEVVVAVDEPGRRELAAPVDPARAFRHGRRRALADGRDPAVRADDVAVGDLAPRVVHGRDRAALDDCRHGSQSGAIYSLRRSSRSTQPTASTARNSSRASAASSRTRPGSRARPGSGARSAPSRDCTPRCSGWWSTRRALRASS